MLEKKITTIQFSGFGGQGIVLSSVIFGAAAVKRAGYNAVQTSSYGSEARGGQCQAELILSRHPIHSPLSDEVDILISMSQMALNQYIQRLKPGKMLIIDPEMAQRPERPDLDIHEVSATRTAIELGLRISANMVMLGFLQQLTNLISQDDLFATIKDHVPSKFLDINLEAARRGIQMAKQGEIPVEK
jgi:2-oxoglutarate ferredoxin oxidoreductase subunit gamma